MSSASNPWLVRLPSPGETCVFSHGYWAAKGSHGDRIGHWKRDALLFHRVYARYEGRGEPPDIPIELSFGLDSAEARVGQHDSQMGLFVAQAYAGWSNEQINEELARLYGPVDPLGFDANLIEEYSRAGVMAEWTYDSTGPFLRRFSEGETLAYEGALSNIPIVAAATATWEQIVAFRGDAESVRKYRDLRLWLRDGLKADSAQHAADIIGQKIDDYRWAIKRHGLNSSLGALKTIFDWKRSGLGVAAASAATVAGGPILGAIAGGLVIASQVGAYLTERRLGAQDAARGANREVAILYDVQERFP